MPDQMIISYAIGLPGGLILDQTIGVQIPVPQLCLNVDKVLLFGC